MLTDCLSCTLWWSYIWCVSDLQWHINLLQKMWGQFYIAYSHKGHPCPSLATVCLLLWDWYWLNLLIWNYGISLDSSISFLLIEFNFPLVLCWTISCPAQVWDLWLRHRYSMSMLNYVVNFTMLSYSPSVQWVETHEVCQFILLIQCQCKALLYSEAVETGQDKRRSGPLTLNTDHCWQ